MAEYNSAYTGQQIDGAVGAVIEKQESWDSKVSAVSITIPKGRVKGDLDGDGKWTEKDANINQKIIVGNIKPTDIEKWCSDVNGDGITTATDTTEIRNLTYGEFNYPDVMADYYENWTFDAASTNWSADIAISNVNSGTDLILNVFDADVYANLVKGEITNTGVTVYMKMPPVSDVVCVGEVCDGSGRVRVNGNNESDGFYAIYGKTTIAELDAAFTAKKILVCDYYGYYPPLMSGVMGGPYFFGPGPEGEQYKCVGGTWSMEKWDGAPVFVATYGTTTYSEIKEAHDAGKLIVLEYQYTSGIVFRIGGGVYFSGLFMWKFFDASNVYKGQDAEAYYVEVKASGWSAKKFSVPYLPESNGTGKVLVSYTEDGDQYGWATLSELGAAAESPSHQVTLTASGWSSTTKQQTVTCADILADVTKQEIHAMPVDASADNAYDAASIRPVAQAANSLTFYAETIPTADIDVYVAIHPLKFS